MASTPHDGANGTTFEFGSQKFTITNLTFNLSDVSSGDQIDISHLGISTGNSLIFQNRPLKGASGGETGKEISIDYIGSVSIAGGTSNSYAVTGGLSLSGNATCLSSSVTLALNDVIRGNASFRLS